MYEPVFEGAVKGYVVNQVGINLWRCIPDYDFKDLEQECYKTFLDCVHWYDTKCDWDKKSAKSFMSYFKSCLHNRFVDLSHLTTRNRWITLESDLSNGGYRASVNDDIAWFELIQDAPEEVGEVLKIILNAPKELFEVLGLQKPGGRWSNSKFCDILGISTQTGMMAKVKKYLFEKAQVEI